MSRTMVDLPRGTVTFLFTDIEGSTAHWERDRRAMAAAVERHFGLLREAVEAHGGVHFKTVGDAIQTAFPTAPAALAAALDAQRALLAEDWPASGAVLVRMALHAGDAEPDASGDYLSAPLNRLSRLLATGHGGQVLLTQAVQQLTRDTLPAGTELRDLGEYRLRDLLEPERVYQLLHPGLPAEFPPLTSLDNRPNNLPRQPTSFLGREREIGDVVALLRRDDIQLLTLTGPGGMGKTRLALQAASELADDFPDGVFFVPLAPLMDPALVPSAIASALGIREEGGRPLADRLKDFLATKQLLLVLDNVEHLVKAVPGVGDLLAVSPQLKVLATSRVPLRLRAEREYPVSPLGLPQRHPPFSPEELSQYEAVRLFIDRAQAVKPDFAVTNENAPAVAEICWRLDGLPLAIELAAVRVRMLSPEAMLARLEKRLPLLTGGARDAPTRQRTLRDAITWSHDLLAPDEQMLFRRLAVFVGGFTLDGAEAVGNHGGGLDVFAGVERLCEQSLLRQEDGPGGDPRFVMLETVREFGLEQLEASGEAEAAHEAHAAHSLALAAAAAAGWWSAAMGEWSARLDAEYPNLLSALDWLAQNDEERLLRLGIDLAQHWYRRGHFVEGRRWMTEALRDGNYGHPELRVRALVWSSGFALAQGDIAQAGHLADEARALAETADDPTGGAMASTLLAQVALVQGDLPRAKAVGQEALARLREVNDRPQIGLASIVLGLAALAEGAGDEATSYLSAALDEFRGLGQPWGIAATLSFLGMAAEATGDTARSSSAHRESLMLRVEHHDRLGIADSLVGLASLAATQGHPARAARLLGTAEARYQDMGGGVNADVSWLYEGAAARARAALGDDAYTEAVIGGRDLPLEQAIAEAFADAA